MEYADSGHPELRAVRHFCDTSAVAFAVSQPVPTAWPVQRDAPMGLRRVEHFFAYQLASTFSERVLRLVQGSQAAQRDFRLRHQLLDSSESAPAHITEGFSRCNPGDFARFLDFAIGALAEAERWLRAGTARGYFDPAEVESALRYKRRAWKACVNLKHSQLREAERRRAARRRPRSRQQPPT